MQTHETILRLSDPMLRAACDLARARDLTVGQVIRDALASELRKARRRRTLERSLTPRRKAQIARVIAESQSWDDLDQRLKAIGARFRPAGGGLALHSFPGGEKLCTASDLGESYGALMRRFGDPFPEHGHVYLVRRLLQDARREAPQVIDF